MNLNDLVNMIYTDDAKLTVYDNLRRKYDGRIRCTKFSKWENRFSCCEHYEDKKIRNLAKRIAEYLGGADNG